MLCGIRINAEIIKIVRTQCFIRLLSVYLGASALVHKLESALSRVIARLHACIETAVHLFTVGRDGSGDNVS